MCGFFFPLYISSLETGFGVSWKECLHSIKPGKECWLLGREHIHSQVHMNPVSSFLPEKRVPVCQHLSALLAGGGAVTTA